jgi:hypothetical protein
VSFSRVEKNFMQCLTKFLFVGIALLALLALATGPAAAQQINGQVQ